ncbi:SET domain-containing protein 3 [Lithohypha guttulata]|uniref:SET domain-containing protein 3 n=1 Tax=Lithohypha guttulata TaxID=1690604 RepID=A0AAN7SU27_9EURO|nr:SET domain-containing protein 3 [Lithohypha guttulata]
MTETSSLLKTYSIPSSYSVTAIPASVSPIPNGQLSPPIIPDEEEYTIKCICGYNDDDGNTVFCEKCDTWQHIVCYYRDKKVPEVHLCTDCAPKDTFPDISVERAREKQRRAREVLEGGGDRRAKRPASKSQKKKHRDTLTGQDLPNGWLNYERQDSSVNGKDHPPPPKKPKTSHRATGSVASINGETRKRAYSNVISYPSPSRSPQELYRSPSIPQYTPEFLDLYTHDEGDISAEGNELTIQGVAAITAWKKEPSLVANSSENAQNDKILFARAEGDWHVDQWPSVSVETIQGKDEVDTKTPIWKLIRLQSDVRKGTIIGEICGQVGTLEEYCQQLNGPNRWKELSHPDPFVFFHPHRDVYIDSRRSGTTFRYIRRSCDPNVTMRSYITADGEVHHCFVAKDDLPAGTELTASWYLNPQLFVNDASRDDKEQLFQERCDYISRVLANFGDCHCGLSRCRLDGFDRRIVPKLLEPPKTTVVRKRKLKTKHTVSPTSNGQPTTSRAGSETIRAPEEDDDHRSSSGSSGNGIRSRDLTPQGGALLDEPPVLGAGLTQREIRKIQALEKAQKEQSQKSEKKTKKRPSGPLNMHTPNSASRSNMDLKRYSGSPPPSHVLNNSSRSTPVKQLSKPVRPVYVSTAVQTDPEPCDPDMPQLKRRKFCTPTQKLLKKLLQHRTQHHAAQVPVRQDVSEVEQSPDIEMKDATTSVSPSPTATKSAPTSPLLESGRALPVPLPSQAAHTHKVHTVFKPPAPRLNLSTLPPVPTFPSTSTSALSVATPSPSLAQSPNSLGLNSSNFFAGNLVNPSPAKKKLSLSDYKSRKKESATPVPEKSTQSLHASSDSQNEAEIDMERSAESSDVVAAAIAPENEQAVEDIPMTDADSVAKRDINQDEKQRSLSSGVQNILSSLQEMQKRQSL